MGFPHIEWHCASSFPQSLDTIFGVAERIAARVAEATEQRFRIYITPPDEQIPAFSVLEAVGNRKVACGHTASLYYVDKDPAFAFDTGLPFGLNGRQQNAWMTQGGGLELIRELMLPYQVVPFPAGSTGAQIGGWFHKEITSLADLRGLRMRISGLGAMVLARLGVITENIPGDQIYEALSSRRIDAAKWVDPYDDEKLGLNTVAKLYHYPGWWESNIQLTLLVNRVEWEGLPSPYQAIFSAACAEANAWLLARYDVVNAPALRRMLATGTLLKAFPKEVMLACHEHAFALYDELSERHTTFRKIYSNWCQFRSEILSWFRVNELHMNNFVLTNLSPNSKGNEHLADPKEFSQPAPHGWR